MITTLQQEALLMVVEYLQNPTEEKLKNLEKIIESHLTIGSHQKIQNLTFTISYQSAIEIAKIFSLPDLLRKGNYMFIVDLYEPSMRLLSYEVYEKSYKRYMGGIIQPDLYIYNSKLKTNPGGELTLNDLPEIFILPSMFI